ncbi:hypothetical protein ACFLU8_01005 [Chloroflexota bacterium]
MKEEQGRQQNEKAEVSLAEIFFLGPEDEKRLHLYALKRFNDWKAEIFNKVPQLEHLTIDEINTDLNTHLNDNEQAWNAKYRDNILEWLGKCFDIGNNYSPYPYATWITHSMYEFKRLVKTAYERKEEKAREEERKREEDRLREEAFFHVYPLQLWKEAERYLSIDEQKKLLDAAGVAIKVYLKEGDSYLDSYETFDYRWWLKEINYRKEKEQIRLDAEAQAQAFRARLDQGLKEIKEKLSPKKEDPVVRFKRYCSNNGENRYQGESFADILASDDDKKKKWKQGYIPAAEAKPQESIPRELKDFILTEPAAAFFLLPSANYSFCGIPCLDIYFDVFAVVTVAVSVQAGSKKLNGIPYNFLTNLQEPKFLGFYQIIITPNEPHFWQSVPISIIRALFDGNLEPQNTTILERTDELTVYEVKKFEEDICEIPISFERYCRNLGSFEKMRELGIIKERIAEILELPRPIRINHKESKSKKAQAFQLYNEGKRPSDSEVKSLGIKPESAYRYYQDWKKEATVGNNRI